MTLKDIIMKHKNDGTQFMVFVNNDFVNTFSRTKLPDNEAMDLPVESYRCKCGKVIVNIEV